MEVSVSPSSAGTVSPSAGEFDEGETVEVRFTPEESWVFISWQGDVTGTDNPILVTMDGDMFFTAVAEQITHPLEIETSGRGSVDTAIITSRGAEYPEGSLLELTAVPDNGWLFWEWEGDLSGVENPQNLTMDEPKSVTAIFVRDNFELDVQTEGEGEVSVKVIEEPAKDIYPFETILELTAQPAAGWEFTGWEGNIDGENLDNPLTVTIDSDISITAIFDRQDFQITIETEGEGTVSKEIKNDPSKSSETYPFETELTLTANPEEGWSFLRWEGDLSGNKNPEVLLMDSNKTITAVFGRKEFDVHVTTEGDGFVEFEIIENPAKQSYPFETLIEITANAANGWYFAEWKGDLQGGENPQQLLVDQNKNITAQFKRQEFELNISIQGNGSVSANPSGSTHEFETIVNLTANAENGWQFSHWEGDISGSNNPREIQMTDNKNVTAVFEEIRYRLSVGTDGEGAVNIDPDKNDFNENEQVVLTAVPNRGWDFIEWRGDLSGNNNPESLTMSSDLSVTAVFATLPSIETSTISNIQVSTARAGGSVSNDGGSPVTSRGVCYNTWGSPDLSDNCTSSGNGTGTFTSDLSNLTPGATYYVRAYGTNSVGTAFGSEVEFRPGVISHGFINGVSPANTSNFQEREYILAEANWGGPGGNNIWLAQNLGSTVPAQSPTSANEWQAGWYFQFNDRQGHFHDGTQVFPQMSRYMGGTTNWEVSNDPCRLALGNEWRIPTSEELDNYRTASRSNGALGSGNRVDAYNSSLRLHTAGVMDFQGQLADRGNRIYLYSSEQSSQSEADYLFVDQRTSNLGNNAPKSVAMPVRCIKD